MSNMGYCRFRNTLNDLQDCDENFFEELDGEEAQARKRMLELCKQIASYDEDDLPVGA